VSTRKLHGVMLISNHLRYVPILFRDHSALHMVGGHNGNFYQRSHQSIVWCQGPQSPQGSFVRWLGWCLYRILLEDETIADLQLFGFFFFILARNIVRLIRIESGYDGRLG
jgi:hypothetical protein